MNAKSLSSNTSETFPESGSWTKETSPSRSSDADVLPFLREPFRSMVQKIDADSLYLISETLSGHVLGMRRLDRGVTAARLHEYQMEAAASKRTLRVVPGTEMRGLILALAECAGELVPSGVWHALTK